MNVYQRLAKAMEEVTYVQKDQKQGMRYSIVSHDKVTAKVRPALLKQGIVYHPIALEHKQDGNRTEVKLTVRFVNIEDKEDYFDVPGLGYGVDNQDKGPGKAISYAVKYCLLKALGLETGDDADNDSIEHKPVVIDEAPDMIMVNKAAEYFKKEIDRDEWENSDKIREALGKLNQSEKLALAGLLNDKAPDSNKKYKTLLKEYIDYVPKTGVAK